MTPLLWLLGAAAAGLVFATRRTIQYRQRAARVWRAVGYDLGLDVVVDRRVSYRALHGEIDGATVQAVTRRPNPDGTSLLGRLATLRSDSMSVVTHVVVKPSKGPALPPVHITAKTLIGELQRKVGVRAPVTIGDDVFDAAVEVSGDEATLLALLGAEARHLVRRLVARGGEVEFGQVTYEAAGLETDAGQLRGLLVHMARAAAILQVSPSQIPARILANFRVEASPAVRQRQVDVLTRRFPKAAETAELLALAIADDAPRVRLAAAAHRPDGGATQRAIVLDERVPVAVRKQALADFARRAVGVEPLLDALLARRPDGLLWEVLRVVRDANHREAAVRLAQMLPRISAPEDAAIVATTIGAVGDARQEGALLEALRREPLVIRRAVTAALGEVGTLRCVAALAPLTEGALIDGPLKDAARAAIAAIQQREAGGAVAGQLAVVEEGGRLALADAEHGRLSLPEGEPE